MKKRLLNYTISISVIILITLVNTILIYAYDGLNLKNNTLDILVINSYGANNQWENHILNGFEDKLKELKPKDLKINIQLEYLDIKKRSDKAYIKSFDDLINTKYQYKHIDIVLALDDEAFNFVKSQVLNPNSILYHKQVLFAGVNKIEQLTNEEKLYINGILSSNTDLLFNLILHLNSNVETINVLIDEFEYSQSIKQRAILSEYLFFRPVNINFIKSNYIEDIQDKLRKINGKNQAIIITGTFVSKSDNSYIPLKEIVSKIKEISKNPLYTNNYEYIFNGALGGYVDVGEYQGQYMAREIYKILNGDKNKDNVLPKSTGVFMFNYKEIYNYDIDIMKIPKGSVILNKPKFALLLPKSLKIIIYLGGILLIIVGFYIVYRLITEKRKSIKNKQLYERAKEREKLKTDFIVNMSHELRTPLNVILSTSKVTELKINKNNYDNEYLLEKLEQINKNSNRLLKLVNNIIDITKFEYGSYTLNLENLNIVEVVEDIVLASVDYSTCKGIDLIFDTEEEEIITAIDKDKIERVILNLLSNSIKFTDKDGTIYVYIKRVEKGVSIIVKDNGIGIPQDKLEEIFNRFYQVSEPLKKHEEGSGIGLCIVEEIIKLHSGKIQVTSRVNEGTNFEIILPIYVVENSFKSAEIKDLNQSVKLEMSDVDTKN